MIYARGDVSNTEGTEGIDGSSTEDAPTEDAPTEDAPTEDAAQVVSDEEMAEIVEAASVLRIEAHTEELADLADANDTD